MTFVFDGIAATREREGTRGDVLALGGVEDMSKLVGQLIEVVQRRSAGKRLSCGYSTKLKTAAAAI